jgi:hypothetical protein
MICSEDIVIAVTALVGALRPFRAIGTAFYSILMSALLLQQAKKEIRAARSPAENSQPQQKTTMASTAIGV